MSSSLSCIGSGLQGVVVASVEREQRFEHGEAADAGIDPTDGQVVGGFVIAPGGGIETERGPALSMRFGVFDEVGGMKSADEPLR